MHSCQREGSEAKASVEWQIWLLKMVVKLCWLNLCLYLLGYSTLYVDDGAQSLLEVT